MTKKNRTALKILFTALFFCLGLPGLSNAQEITATIAGTVTDSTGAAVSGATVNIIDPSKNDLVVRTLTTNDDGNYSAPNLPTGVYRVTVEAANFKKTIQNDITVNLGERRTIDFALDAGNISEVVTVEADAVSVDTQSAASGTVINGDQVRELSVNNRNFVQLVTLAPGVSNDLADQVYVGTTNPDGQANTVSIAVNGARSSQNTFTVDGADVTDRGSNLTIQAYPSVDSIGEFRVLRSLYPAESGRSGGGQVNVVTKSGTDRFSFSAFEFIRNEAFNANNLLINSSNNPPLGRDANGKARRVPFRYNNYGWTAGGPIYFFNFGEGGNGGLFRRYEKTFFFFSQEIRKDRRFTAPTTVTIPDAQVRNFIFPIDVCIARNNVSTENCTVGNPGRLAAGTPIPVDMRSPAAVAYINSIYNLLPLPNSPVAGNPYSSTTVTPNVSDFRQELIKIDTSFTNNLSGFYRYQRDKIPTLDAFGLFSGNPGLPGVAITSTDSPGRTHTGQMTYVVKPNLILEGRVTYGYGAILSRNIGTISLAQTQIPITLPFANQRDRNPTISGNGFTNLSGFGPYDNFSYKVNYSGGATWILGNHTMKVGGIFSNYRKNENALAGNNEGIFSSFSTTRPTGQVLPSTISTTTANNLQAFANFLVGNVVANGFTQASFDYTADLRQKTIEAYAQDEWRFRPNITVYYGVRYSYFGSPYDKNGRLSNFVPELFNKAQAPVVNGSGQRVLSAGSNYCNGIIVNAQNYQTGPASFNCTPTISPYGKYVVDVNKTDFAPRIGVAWDPFGDGKTAIRTGYGIYHEQVLNGVFLQHIGLNPPYQVTATNPLATRLDSPAANIAAPPAIQSLRAVQDDWNTPYMQHWSFDVQRQLTSKTVVTAGYYGSKGTHLIGVTELNDIAPGVARNSNCVNAAGATVNCQPQGYVFRNTASAPNNPNGAAVDLLILDQLRPYRGFRSIAIIQPKYTSNYHSLQMTAVHRLSGASQFNVAYTFAKNLTDAQTDRSSAPQDTYNTRAEYGRAALDRQHVFTANFVYELPAFKESGRLVRTLLGGWQASSILTFQSGLPFTITTSNLDPAGTGLINANPAGRPNLLCDPNANAPQTRLQYFNTACFQANPLNTVDTAALGFQNIPGTAGRSIVEGPGTRRVDFTLAKNFRFGENVRVQLRAETFNIFNWVNFRGLGTNVTLANFGQVTTVRDPRTMQFGIKLNF